MRVISAEAMQEADRRTIRELGVPGLVLMENAGRACVAEIVSRFVPGRVLVLAGRGNNGGDGYVIARLLEAQGWTASVIVMAAPGEITGDAQVNLERLPGSAVTFAPAGLALQGDLFGRADLIVDALFGTGLKKDLAGIHAEAVQMINASGKPVVAVDIPSGVHGTSGKIMGASVRASLTVTFASAKLGHVLYPGCECAGELVVADIGIPEEVLRQVPGIEFVDRSVASRLVNRRERTAHKGSYGHTFIIAGSTGKTGAAALAAGSAVRAGAGLVTVAVPERVHDIMEVKTTESMTLPVPDAGSGRFLPAALSPLEAAIEGKDAVALGPGISWSPDTAALVRELAPRIDAPLVLDADALNAISGEPDLLLRRRRETILTPHPGEMARLCGTSVPEVEADRIATAVSFATRYRAHLVLKGARTVIATPDGNIFLNGSGNPGMASGGMGDVLTGILAALLGQWYSPADACLLGVFLHGYAADLAAAEIGEIGLAAGDVRDRIPLAYRKLMEEKERC